MHSPRQIVDGKRWRSEAKNLGDLVLSEASILAESHEAAAKLFENHPHFTIFPGDSVEIMECLPMTGQ